MATANFLWGAPRIYGELLKLGITVSERTVSRYLLDRLTTRSQTWRTSGESHWQPGVHLDGDAKRTRQARLVSSVAIVSVVWFASTPWRRKIIFRTLHA